ncbi:hypothetical protein RND81_13G009900 [Saponaria officinalis]|uniref:Uncharacterized protein n=1 Tax=Saponaria officinalis TaxID=3572 RepID=A0AAW1GY63_SAPOF
MVLEDEKGNRIHGALFGDQIEGYKEAIVYNGVYEIANAPLKPSVEQYKSHVAEVNYQMTFGRQTVIQSMEEGSEPTSPEYRSIALIPKASSPDEKFDVLGFVLYIEDSARRITSVRNRELVVREVVITDHSTAQPLTISAWNDLASNECRELSNWSEKFMLVGFTALRASNYKGFSLTTTMSTTFIYEPKGDRAKALAEWGSGHQQVLRDRQARVLEVRDPRQVTQLTTIEALKQKKAHNTLQEERHRLRVVIPNVAMDKVHAYLGYSNCGRSADVPAGHTYTCTNCSAKDCVSSPRVTFNCEASDGTGKLSLTFFTTDCEKLLKMSAPEIFKIKHSDDMQAFEALHTLLNNTHVLIEVRPQKALSINNVLQWVLKKIVVDDGESGSNSEVKLNSPAQKEADIQGLTAATVDADKSVDADKPGTSASPGPKKTQQEDPILSNKLENPAENKSIGNLKYATDEA